jgi:hypothetical protein
VYQVEAWASLRRAVRGSGRGGLRAAVSPNVLALGMTSLLTDVSAEMVNTVLPAYLVLHLGLTPLSFGLLDGLAQGLSAFIHLFTGTFADRFRRCKELAGVGYALSAVAKLGLFTFGTTWAPIAALVAVDRLGKGIRTVPRDLLISLSTRTGSLATAFGVHRGLDSAGAMLGPVVALGILSTAPAGFDIVFLTSFAVAVCGVAALVLFVQNIEPEAPMTTDRARVLAPLVGAFRTPGMARLVLAVLGLGVATVGDAFLYLVLQRHIGFSAGLLPLLYIGTAGSYVLMSLPVGLLADVLGRTRTFLGGYVLLCAAYLVAWSAEGGTWVHAGGVLLLLGGYYAATDGVLMAVAGGLCAAERRGSGMALLTTTVGTGRLLAAVAFGALWTSLGSAAALGAFVVAMLTALTCAALLLRGLPEAAAEGT